jgi:hypothetical protein
MSGSNFGDSMGWSSSGRSSGSRRGKRGGGSGGADKPKQPQRGLGVAQLEKIRLQSEMAEYFHPLSQPPSLIHRTGSLNLVSDGRLGDPLPFVQCSSLWLGSPNFLCFWEWIDLAGGCTGVDVLAVVVAIFLLLCHRRLIAVPSQSKFFGT